MFSLLYVLLEYWRNAIFLNTRTLKTLVKRVNVVQLVLDLLIVFIGVSLAFLVTSYQEQRKKEKETGQILSLIDIGLNRYEKRFEGYVMYHKKYNTEFREKLNTNTLPNFATSTYPSPAYPIDAISLVTSQGYQILGPVIYVKLTEFSNAIQRLSYTEQKLVYISEKSMELTSVNYKTSDQYHLDQKKWARQYLLYLEVRKRILEELLQKSSDLRTLIRQAYATTTIETSEYGG